MANLSYLSRRGSGRYYLQIRMPLGPAWPALLRLSLQTSDAKIARRSLCNALTWLMPFRDAETLTRQAQEVLDQCRRYIRAGSAVTWPDLEDRKTGSQGINWWSMAALATTAIAPLVIVGIVLERFIVKGLTAGAVK